jgi:hypothetical protein
MPVEPLDVVPLWLLFLFQLLLLGVGVEAGFRLGVWRHNQAPDEKESHVGAMVASILGLLALVLGFTFGLAAQRFDARREVVLEEANAIGTAYLRARLLPAPERAAVEGLLREYTALRIRAVEQQDLRGLIESEALHQKLWDQASSAAEKSPTSIMTGLFVTSLNEVIDLDAKRVMLGLRSRVPLAIWISVFALSFVSTASVGYHSGLGASRRSPVMLGLLIAFSMVLLLIVDLDRAHEGLLQVSQQSMLDVQQAMQPAKAP